MSAHKTRAAFDHAAHAAAAALADPLTNAAITANPRHAAELELELERVSNRDRAEVSAGEEGASELPPVDTGKGALTFLAAAFFLGKSRPPLSCAYPHHVAALIRSCGAYRRACTVGLFGRIRSDPGKL